VHPRGAVRGKIDEGAQLVLDRIVDHRARRLDRIEFPLDVGEPHRSRLGLWCAVLKFGFQFTDERIALIGKTVDAILLVLAQFAQRLASALVV
jgi:hypothetical protein